MKRNKWRPFFAIMALVMTITIFFRCCNNDDKNNKNTSTQKTNTTGTPMIVPNMDTSDIQIMETVSTDKNQQYNDHNNLDLIDVDFKPDDISLVDREYLDNIVIIGDSITKGYSVYGRMKADNVLAVGSVGTRNLFTYTYNYQGYSLDLLDILKRKLPEYIFISLGMNDINILSEDEYTEVYENNIDEILKATPDSTIIVTAITPITSDNDFTQNEKIDKYNEALRKMAIKLRDKKVYYINSAQYLKNEYGCLISDFSSGDGIHLSEKAYDYMLSYMLTMLEWL